MPVNTLSVDESDVLFKGSNEAEQHYHYSETVNGTGDWLILPAGVGDVCVSVSPSSGSARVEFTQGTVAEVEAGTATGRAWPAGDATAFTSSVMASVVTAVRCVSTAATDFVVTA